MNRRIVACMLLIPVLFVAWVVLSRQNVSKARAVFDNTQPVASQPAATSNPSTTVAPTPKKASPAPSQSADAVELTRGVLVLDMLAHKLTKLENEKYAVYLEAETAKKEAQAAFLKSHETFRQELEQASLKTGPVHSDFAPVHQAKLRVDAAETKYNELNKKEQEAEDVFRNTREVRFKALGEAGGERKFRADQIAKKLGESFNSANVEKAILAAEVEVVKELAAKFSTKSGTAEALKQYELAAVDFGQSLDEELASAAAKRKLPDLFWTNNEFEKTAATLLAQPVSKDRVSEYEQLRETGRKIVELRPTDDKVRTRCNESYKAFQQSQSRYRDALGQFVDAIIADK